ncbi:MAG: hypothetical protein J07HN4v3_00592 [Halonotius sp. J07HN4]|nr:MAG: hypothetical protein J07HN4v3_00592 [Halonotius sp. J07HN4]
MSSITRPTRRRLLAVGGATAVAGLAGCMDAFNAVAGAILKDVNVLNGTDQEQSGTVTVVGPNGDTQLEESFTVTPSESDNEESESGSTPTYGDVFTESGEYTVTVELESAINETSSREASVTVNDTENQHIIVGLGADDAPTPIEVLVIDEFSDLADRFNDTA